VWESVGLSDNLGDDVSVFDESIKHKICGISSDEKITNGTNQADRKVENAVETANDSPVFTRVKKSHILCV
jgi:hypothetical protein